jgi:hypothetical protein
VENIVDLKLLPEKASPPVNVVRGKEKKPDPPLLTPPQPIQQPAEPQEPEIPRLRRVPSMFGSASRVPSGRHDIIKTPARNGPLQGYCGDGICDANERAHPGRCPRDCGH